MKPRIYFRENLGKGLALGFLSMLALRQPNAQANLVFGLCALGGLLIALLLAAWLQRRLQQPGQRSVYFLLLLLEHPGLLHPGILGGMLLAVVLLRLYDLWTAQDLYWACGIGAAIGVIFTCLQSLPHRSLRRALVLLYVLGALALVLWTLESLGAALQGADRTVFGLTLLAVIPVLYLLTFTGMAEETELEIGTVCIVLGIACWLLAPPTARPAAFALPVLLYFFYVTLYLPKLRAFKHVIRGMSFAQLKQPGFALLAFRKALAQNPSDRLAHEQFWRLHRTIDLQDLKDATLVKLIDFGLCIQRAAELLLSGSPPSADRIDDALKLLDLVQEHLPQAYPAVLYWRAVANTHRQEYDKAAEELRIILDDSAAVPDQQAFRQNVLMPAWQLALTQHPELRKRVGEPWLQEPRHLFDAIAAVEDALVRSPQEPAAHELKPLLYERITLPAYETEAGNKTLHAASAFDHEYCITLAEPLLTDESKWGKGIELLRIAARGLPQQAPCLLRRAALTAAEHGNEDLAAELQNKLIAQAREFGTDQLTPESKEAYYAALKYAAERASKEGRIRDAIHFYTLYIESPSSGQDTVNFLTELYEQLEDVPHALFFNERALMYDAGNNQYQDRKDRYYYSLSPADYSQHAELLSRVFDVAYCTTKAKQLLDLKSSGPEQQDWALHLARLALTVDAANISSLVQAARAHLRRGETDEALPLLETAHQGKESIKSGEDQEAWYLACRLLGDLYLQSGDAARALACFKDFRSSAKSGADTLFKMAQALEQLGERDKAAKFYENVTTYQEHPLVGEARLAMDRLRQPLE